MSTDIFKKRANVVVSEGNHAHARREIITQIIPTYIHD